jgi:Xaa-Pro aminopeptidase
MARKVPTPEEIAALKQAMDLAELDFINAKVAFFHDADYKDKKITYDVLSDFAEFFIAQNYAFQKAMFGRVRVKLSVPRLMRE